MLTKRMSRLLADRSLPQRKSQFNIPLEQEAILPQFTNPGSKKFHPYLSNINVEHLHRDFNHTLAVGITTWRQFKANLLPKRTLISLSLVAITLLGIGNSSDFQKIIVPKGVILATNQNSVPMAATIVADNVPVFNWPVIGYISTKYSRWHPGIDIPRPKGTPIKPIASGTVTVVENGRFGYGRSIIVSHAGGYASRYAHLSRVDVKVGDSVNIDTTLGGVGNTGHSTGNHLHLEIYTDGKALNPLSILPQQTSVATAHQ